MNRKRSSKGKDKVKKPTYIEGANFGVSVDNVSCKGCTLVKVDSVNKPGILLEVVQILTDLDLIITKAYISSDGGWFMDAISALSRLLLLLFFSYCSCCFEGLLMLFFSYCSCCFFDYTISDAAGKFFLQYAKHCYSTNERDVDGSSEELDVKRLVDRR